MVAASTLPSTASNLDLISVKRSKSTEPSRRRKLRLKSGRVRAAQSCRDARRKVFRQTQPARGKIAHCSCDRWHHRMPHDPHEWSRPSSVIPPISRVRAHKYHSID